MLKDLRKIKAALRSRVAAIGCDPFSGTAETRPKSQRRLATNLSPRIPSD